MSLNSEEFHFRAVQTDKADKFREEFVKSLEPVFPADISHFFWNKWMKCFSKYDSEIDE
jgi:hypothetical protein